MSKVIAVIGAQWGDEGKGKIVDLLAERFEIVVRYQGGHNAGHSVQVGDQSFVLHLLPSGIVHRGKTCVLGNGMVIDPKAFFVEADRLTQQGIEVSPERVKISSRAHLILPYHRALDHTSEERLGNEKVGTTLRGIGPAYEDKAGRRGIRTADALVPDVLRSRIERNLEECITCLNDIITFGEFVAFFGFKHFWCFLSIAIRDYHYLTRLNNRIFV